MKRSGSAETPASASSFIGSPISFSTAVEIDRNCARSTSPVIAAARLSRIPSSHRILSTVGDGSDQHRAPSGSRRA